MKLEIKHIAPYLPFEVKVIDTEAEDCIWTLHPYKDSLDCLTDNEHLSLENFITENNATKTPTHKLLLRQLSNYADIDSEALCDLNCDVSDQIQVSEFASKRISISSVSVGAFEILVSNHVDVFGLIDEGLALPLI